MTDEFSRWRAPGADSEIEVLFREAEKTGPVILVWPGMGVDVRMYRFPVGRFIAGGFSVVLYNPRSHGNAGGSPTREGFPRDIEAYLREAGLAPGSLTVIAHSAGCDGALRLSENAPVIEKFFFISPILNPRESICFMYSENSIDEFTVLLAARSSEPALVKDVLGDTRWLERNYWNSGGLRESLDSVSGEFLIGSFLEEYFVESFDASSLLSGRAGKCEILLPRHDSWFSTDRTRELAAKHGCRCATIETAGDHFFMRAWGDVWNYIERGVRSGRSGTRS